MTDVPIDMGFLSLPADVQAEAEQEAARLSAERAANGSAAVVRPGVDPSNQPCLQDAHRPDPDPSRPATKTEPCPNAAAHQSCPSDYIAGSSWADDAMLVATQETCSGCGRWEIWVPKRPDLRIAVDWPAGSCDWGKCDGEGVAERYSKSNDMWLPVCANHVGPVREPSVRGTCGPCGKEYTLTKDGLLRAHDHGWDRCVGSHGFPTAAKVETT